MILEIATLDIMPGKEAAFEAGVAHARALFARAKGCRGMALRRTVENPSTYLLLVEWDRLEDHTVGFRNSEDFPRWRELVGGFFATPPVVVHGTPVTLSGDA